MQTLKEIINSNAQKYPDKIAFIFENKRFTYKQVNQRINSLINALASMGVGKEDRIGILAHNCPQYFEVFSIDKAGMVCVPLNHRSAGRELAYFVNNSESNTLVLGKEFIDVVDSVRHELVGVRNFICLDAAVENIMSYEWMWSYWD